MSSIANGWIDLHSQCRQCERQPWWVALENPFIRLFSGLTFYTLLPVAMMLFAWKAAVFPAWGSSIFGVAVTVIAYHVMLPFSRLSWRSKGFLSVSVAMIITGGVVFGSGPLRRPFNFSRANLSGQWLQRRDFHNANFSGANLSHAKLGNDNLSNTDLSNVNLSYANLSAAKLFGANLYAANLSYAGMVGAHLNNAKMFDVNLTHAFAFGADLSNAYMKYANLGRSTLGNGNLSKVNLSGANLSGANGLIQKQLNKSCGNSSTTLPRGLTLMTCLKHR